MISTFLTAIHAADRIWKQFCFAPVASFNFALFRTGLGLLTFIWCITLVPDFDAFFGAKSIASSPAEGRGWFSIFLWLESDRFLWPVLLLSLVASSTLMMGRLTRIGGPVLALSIPSIMTENQILWNAGDDLFQTLHVLFGFYCLLTPSSDLDIALQLPVHGNKGSTLRKGRIWFFQLVKVQMAIVYFVAFINKIPGSEWRDGTASMIVFRVETLERFPIPSLLETNYLLGNMLTWYSLALEGSLPLLLWKRATRPYAIAAAIVFHLMIDWSLTIGLFSWIMILGLMAFLPPGADAWLRTMGLKLKICRTSSHANAESSRQVG